MGCSPWVTESDTFSMGRKWHYVVTFFEENMVISFSSLLGKLNTNNILNLNLSLLRAVSTVSPSISHEVMGPDAMIFVF